LIELFVKHFLQEEAKVENDKVESKEVANPVEGQELYKFELNKDLASQ
jgi:hypothetical protein